MGTASQGCGRLGHRVFQPRAKQQLISVLTKFEQRRGQASDSWCFGQLVAVVVLVLQVVPARFLSRAWEISHESRASVLLKHSGDCTNVLVFILVVSVERSKRW